MDAVKHLSRCLRTRVGAMAFASVLRSIVGVICCRATSSLAARMQMSSGVDLVISDLSIHLCVETVAANGAMLWQLYKQQNNAIAPRKLIYKPLYVGT